MSDLENAIEQATKGYAERLDKELRGAYRAGYNYIYIGTERDTIARSRTGDDVVSLPRQVYFPSCSELKPKELVDDADRYVWERYDLDIPAAKHRAFMRENSTT